MTASPPEEVATDLIRAIGQTEPPVDLFRIVGLFPGVGVTAEPLDNEGYIVQIPGGAEILASSRARPERQRFTIAHELGHYVLNSVLAGSDGEDSHAEAERWCDRFAVGLLMPQRWVVNFVERGSPERLAIRVAAGPRVFDVSRTSFWMRVAESVNAWVFELVDDGQTAVPDTRFRISPPPEAIAVALTCIDRLKRGEPGVHRGEGLHGSCVWIGSSMSGRQRTLAIVGAA